MNPTGLNECCFCVPTALETVACYNGAVCAGVTPPIVATVEECCLQDISALKSYRTANEVETCHPCLGTQA